MDNLCYNNTMNEPTITTEQQDKIQEDATSMEEKIEALNEVSIISEQKTSPEPILSVVGANKEDTPISENTENTVNKVQIGKPFEKGDDPRRNLNGRPLGAKNFNTLFEEALKKISEINGKTPDEFDIEIIAKGIEKARTGEYKFYRDLMDRRFGRPLQPMDMTTGGDKIREKVVWEVVDFTVKKDEPKQDNANS